MQEFKKIEKLTNDLKDYLDTNIQLLKLEALANVTAVGSGMIGAIIIGVVGFLFILFFSLAGADLLSMYFGSKLIGLAIVAGFYLVLGLGLFLGREKLFFRPFRDMITKLIFKSK
jgi:hypothetical protein